MQKNNSKIILEQVDYAFSSISEDDDELSLKFNSFDVRDAFLEFICSFMKNYNNCINIKKVHKHQEAVEIDYDDIF